MIDIIAENENDYQELYQKYKKQDALLKEAVEIIKSCDRKCHIGHKVNVMAFLEKINKQSGATCK